MQSTHGVNLCKMNVLILLLFNPVKKHLTLNPKPVIGKALTLYVESVLANDKFEIRRICFLADYIYLAFFGDLWFPVEEPRRAWSESRKESDDVWFILWLISSLNKMFVSADFKFASEVYSIIFIRRRILYLTVHHKVTFL